MPEISEEFARIAYEINYLRAQAEQVQRQLAAVTELLEESAAVDATLQAIKQPEKAIFPIGAGVFLKTSLTPEERSKVLVDAGAKVFVERTPEEASKFLQARQQELTQAARTLQDSLKTMGKRIEELDAQASKFYAKERK